MGISQELPIWFPLDLLQDDSLIDHVKHVCPTCPVSWSAGSRSTVEAQISEHKWGVCYHPWYFCTTCIGLPKLGVDQGRKAVAPKHPLVDHPLLGQRLHCLRDVLLGLHMEPFETPGSYHFLRLSRTLMPSVDGFLSMSHSLTLREV